MYRFLAYLLLICLLLSSCAPKEALSEESQKDNKMVFVKGGQFKMGSSDRENDRDIDEIQRRVTVSSFYIGKYEVTQKEFVELMDINPSAFPDDSLPVENISWFYAIEYCNRLSMSEGLMPVYGFDGINVVFNRKANGYRLPTEAEWEYACRAGKKSTFNTGKKITPRHANYNNNIGFTSPAGRHSPNSWGIFDMPGNVFEWCWDWHSFYNKDDTIDPQGPAAGSNRVIRGGSWANGENTLRSAYRNFYSPSSGNDRIGFRLARNAD